MRRSSSAPSHGDNAAILYSKAFIPIKSQAMLEGLFLELKVPSLSSHHFRDRSNSRHLSNSNSGGSSRNFDGESGLSSNQCAKLLRGFEQYSLQQVLESNTKEGFSFKHTYLIPKTGKFIQIK